MTEPEKPTAEQPVVSPSVSTDPVRGPWHFSRLPSHLGRARTSTLVLSVLFLAIGALYLNIRPPETGAGQPAPVPTSPTSAPETPPETTTSEPATTTSAPETPTAPTTSAEPTTTGGPSETTAPEEPTETPVPTEPSPSLDVPPPTEVNPPG